MNETDPNIVEEPTASEYNKIYTYSDYLKFEYDYMVELIRGRIFKMSPAPKNAHQEISGNIYGHIWSFLKGSPCKVYSAPFDVVLPVRNEKKDTATTVIQPDICIICDQSKLNEAGCLGAPDLVIEILSKSTSKKDLNDKYSIYEETGVTEYWIVMPNERLVEVFHLQEGSYQRITTYTETEMISPVIFPDLVIELIDIFPKEN